LYTLANISITHQPAGVSFTGGLCLVREIGRDSRERIVALLASLGYHVIEACEV
jgi:hypothetical protein